MLNKDLQKIVEFIVEYRRPTQVMQMVEKPVNFIITPESLQNVKDVSKKIALILFLNIYYFKEIENSEIQNNWSFGLNGVSHNGTVHWRALCRTLRCCHQKH